MRGGGVPAAIGGVLLNKIKAGNRGPYFANIAVWDLDFIVLFDEKQKILSSLQETPFRNVSDFRIIYFCWFHPLGNNIFSLFLLKYFRIN